MLNEEQLKIVSEAIAPLFNYLEREVIADIARRIAKTLTYTRTAELQAIAMRKLGYSPNKIRTEALRILQRDKAFQKEVERNTIEYKQEIKEIIADIVEEAKENGDTIIASSGEMAWIDDLRVWESNGTELTDSSFIAILTRAIQMQTAEEIINLSKSSAFKLVSGLESLENAYRSELNKALIKICSGTFSADTVVRETIHALSKSGLRSVDYASGKTMQLDSAVKLAVRTGAHQLSGQIQKENIQKTNVQLVYVSEHENARNEGEGIRNHEFWQGKVYRISGTSEEFAEEARRIGQESIEDLWEKTGYSLDDKHTSNPLGLYGYNCRHTTYPWFIGASELPERIKPRKVVEYRGRELDGYAQTQEMRRQERAIRSLKRERDALKTLNLNSYEVEAKIKEATNEYKHFCELCGAPVQTSNLRYESGTSDLKKTEAWKAFERMAKSK